MLLVVYHHIIIYAMPGYYSALDSFFVSFRMPMFFFISGFVSYSMKRIWSASQLWKSIKKKVEGQLLPSIVVLFIFCVTMELDYVDGLTSELKYGYWFTFASFGIYLIWSVFNFLIEQIGVSRKKIADVLLGGVTVGICAFHHFVTKDSNQVIIATLSLDSVSYYFFFFICGVQAKRYLPMLHSLLKHKYLFLLVLLMAVCPLELNKVLSLFVKLARVLCIYQVFHHYAETFLMDYLNRSLGYLGRHTLEVYFIHFFLLFGLPYLPAFLQSVSEVSMPIVKGCTPLVEGMMVGVLSVLVAIVCLLIRKVVDCAPLLSRLCFGPIPKKS